jgi:glycosyltransferase involved in cell wall biosynthesis
MKEPLVSCIMPTANRKQFVQLAIAYFLRQDYPNRELVILDDGTYPIDHFITYDKRIKYYHSKSIYGLGVKRNICCENSLGEIIVHWDDDDWYAEDWISQQVHSLIQSGADITGINNINYFSLKEQKVWKYVDSIYEIPWVYGATLAYWKSFWRANIFRELNIGEDNDFIWRSSPAIYAHNYTKGYLGIIHENNAGLTFQENPRQKLQMEKWIKEIDGPEKNEILSGAKNNRVEGPLVSCIMPTSNRQSFITEAIDNFIKQDYINKELIIIDDGGFSIKHLIPINAQIKYYYFPFVSQIGTKRNIACQLANGEFILHFDDDDWYAVDWISQEVSALETSDADIAGLDQIQFYLRSTSSYRMIKNYNSKQPWLTGATLIYRKSFWIHHPFKELNVGEDDDYVRNTGAKVYAHKYYQGFVATIHENNTNQNTSALFSLSK